MNPITAHKKCMSGCRTEYSYLAHKPDINCCISHASTLDSIDFIQRFILFRGQFTVVVIAFEPWTFLTLLEKVNQAAGGSAAGFRAKGFKKDAKWIKGRCKMELREDAKWN